MVSGACWYLPVIGVDRYWYLSKNFYQCFRNGWWGSLIPFKNRSRSLLILARGLLAEHLRDGQWFCRSLHCPDWLEGVMSIHTCLGYCFRSECILPSQWSAYITMSPISLVRSYFPLVDTPYFLIQALAKSWKFHEERIIGGMEILKSEAHHVWDWFE